MQRRHFLAGTLAAPAFLPNRTQAAVAGKPAVLGGEPVRTARFPSWPVFDGEEEKGVLNVLRSGRWNRGVGNVVEQFETAYAQTLGAKGCLATANGTSALLTAINALDIGPGDEVIVPPYTFVATINVVLQVHAVPVFVDTDPESFQIDAKKIEAAMTDRTAAIMPVHLGGSVADIDAILEIAKRRNLPVIEDACQSHLAEWRGRKVGTFGTCGAFSFQASKNLNSGEGGAVVSNDPAFIERCYAFHNNSRGHHTGGEFAYMQRGLNLRMPEFQGALLIAQMTRLQSQMRTREQNAEYLTRQLKEVPGITPARMYPGCTRNAYHLYMFRYDPAHFSGLTRARFLQALSKEGIPASSGYSPLNKEPFLKNTLTGKGFRRVYGEKEAARWEERNQCPANDRLCSEAVWLTQTMLLGPRQDMDDVVTAIRKIQRHAADLAKA